MPTPRISVLMPVYNAAGTLPEALQSIAGQTMGEFEVIAVDDGSDDDSGTILEAWRRGDRRIKPIHAGRAGLVAALNHGLSLCKGDWVARIDADDRMHPDRLARQAALLESRPEISVAGSLVEIFADGPVGEGMKVYEAWLNSLVEPGDIAREIFIESPIAHPSAIVRRDVLAGLGGYRDAGWPEDYDLWLRCHAAGLRFAKVPETLLYWREHTGRLTHTDSRYSVENFLRVKARFLVDGPLKNRDGLIVWGAGQTGRRLSKHLVRMGRPVDAFVDISPRKIGGILRGAPVIGPGELPETWARYTRPMLIAAVSSRGARKLIRQALSDMGLAEVDDYLCAA
jgi:glycosyltransferase involved in cell wall biosynthesis